MSRYRRIGTQGDLWRDSKGRFWFTSQPENLPADPSAYDTIPPQFHYRPPGRPEGEPSSARIMTTVKAGHRLAELHVKKRRLLELAPNRVAFLQEDWAVLSPKIRDLEDWDRTDGEPPEARERPLTELEVGMVLAYALNALGYDGRGGGLWGENKGFGNVMAEAE